MSFIDNLQRLLVLFAIEESLASPREARELSSLRFYAWYCDATQSNLELSQ